MPKLRPKMKKEDPKNVQFDTPPRKTWHKIDPERESRLASLLLYAIIRPASHIKR